MIPAPRRPEPSGHPAGRTARAARPGRALLTITLDQRWLTDTLTTRGRHRGYGLLDSGAPVHPATLRRWACDADIVPIVLGPKSEPLDVGRLQRTVTDAIRRALNLRDGGCAFPDCTRRPRRCHAHHIRHWRDHGPTRIDNLVLLCSYHHQLLHHGHWTVTIRDGRPWFTPPHWIDPTRQPRLGGRPRIPV
ncbi:HNH endonuclease signature motif containing protein [Actinomycetospora flava]|uniref:HNH endonuclease signature motif containing protein n=1 Tax=Actinomycetospora flava TaxID=3129232 RepID=UPI0035A04690